MKHCPMCDTDYPSHHTGTCPKDGAVLIEIKTWEPGTVIRDRYRILNIIGKGGMGTVYKALHIKLDEVRALKVMSTALVEDSQFVKRFRQEAQAASKLHHVNCVHVNDFDQAEDGQLFIAMDYVDGVSLRQLLTSTPSPLSVERALAIARGVAEGLAAAHSLGMVHRDIKPENILLAHDAQGRDVPKILDFGIVAMKESSTTLSTRGLMLTANYASPEQWQGTKAEDLDGRTDLYALGGALYEMLTGQTPFHAHNNAGWMYQHLNESPKPPSASRPELAQMPGLDALVLKLLAKKPDDRPASALAFLQELNLVETRRYVPSSTSMPTILETKTSATTTRAATSSTQQDGQTLREDPRELERQHGSRHGAARKEAGPNNREGTPKTALLILAAVVLCAIVGLGVLLLWNSRATQQTSGEEQPTLTSVNVPAPAVAPTATLTANPQVIKAGHSVTLTWNTNNASDISIDPIGTVEANGTRTLSPPESVNYRLTAKGPGGSADSSVWVAVSPPEESVIPPPKEPANPSVEERPRGEPALLVTADLRCNWSLDGEPKGQMEAGQTVRVPVGLGKHIIEAVTPDELDHWRGVAELTKPQQEIVAVELGTVRGKRLREAADAERLRQEEAAAKRQRQLEPPHQAWTDPSTGLMWTEKDNGFDVNWNEAVSYCQNLSLGGYSDWRLAAIDELAAIHDLSKSEKFEDYNNTYHIKGGIKLSGGVIWSGTPSSPTGAYALYFHSGFGNPRGGLGHGIRARALCVHR